MELREVLSALRANWWLVLSGLVAGGVLAATLSLLMTPVYTARIQLFVSTSESMSTSEVLTGSQFSQQRVTSYAELLAGEELAARVIDRLELSVTPEELAAGITASAVPDTVLLDVTVTDPSASGARDIAEAVGVEFRRFVRELETPAGTDLSPVKVTVVDRPELATSPSEPQVPRNVALGVLAGLFLGAAAAVARARLDRSVRDPDEVAALAGAPVIGTILQDPSLATGHVIQRSSSSRSAEDYRQLRTNLQFLNVDDPPKVIMISSALPSEGKTTVAINLSLALAESGRNVALVEADLRRPKVSRYLGLVSGVGLTNVLAGTAEIDEVVQIHGSHDLTVLAAGPMPPNPGDLLGSVHMSALLDKLRAAHDFVIVDAAPLLPVADSTGLAPFVDGVLLSVRYGTTHKAHVREAGATLDRVRARALGVILNIVPPKAAIATAQGYGYAYETDDGRRR